MNEVANRTQSTALGALKSLKAGIANVQQTMVKKSGNPYLRMLKDGAWVYGQEDIQVEEGSLWAANPFSIEHGWTAWKRGEGVDNSGGPLGEVMVPMSSPCPAKTTLHEVGADWEYQMSIEFRCLNGTDKGEQVLYKASSVGASKAMDAIVKAIGHQLDADQEHPVPVVEFGSSTYKHKKYGQTYEPVIAVKSWAALTLDAPEVEEPVGAQPEPAKNVEPEKPKRAARSVPVTKSTPAQDAPADEDDELAAMEAAIAAKKAARDKAAQETIAVDPVAARKAALLAEMAALDAETAAPATAPADGQPLRRRRNV